MDDESAIAQEALLKTDIMNILSKIFDFETVEEEFYCMKMEALWILINLATCDTDEACIILQSEYNDNKSTLYGEQIEAALLDFESKKSEILPKLDLLC